MKTNKYILKLVAKNMYEMSLFSFANSFFGDQFLPVVI